MKTKGANAHFRGYIEVRKCCLKGFESIGTWDGSCGRDVREGAFIVSVCCMRADGRRNGDLGL